jgi:hypothetical protein
VKLIDLVLLVLIACAIVFLFWQVWQLSELMQDRGGYQRTAPGWAEVKRLQLATFADSTS